MSKDNGYVKYTCDKCGKIHYSKGDCASALYPATLKTNLKEIDFGQKIEIVPSDFVTNEVNYFPILISEPTIIAVNSKGEKYDRFLGGEADISLKINEDGLYLCKDCANEIFSKYIDIIEWFEELKGVN